MRVIFSAAKGMQESFWNFHMGANMYPYTIPFLICFASRILLMLCKL